MDCAFKTVASFARHRVLILSFLFDFPMTLGVFFSLLLLFLYDSEGFWFTKTANKLFRQSLASHLQPAVNIDLNHHTFKKVIRALEHSLVLSP